MRGSLQATYLGAPLVSGPTFSLSVSDGGGVGIEFTTGAVLLDAGAAGAGRKKIKYTTTTSTNTPRIAPTITGVRICWLEPELPVFLELPELPERLIFTKNLYPCSAATQERTTEPALSYVHPLRTIATGFQWRSELYR
jgi:hypothetical protein